MYWTQERIHFYTWESQGNSREHFTPPKFNIDTKNGGFGKRNSFQIRQFLVSMLNFRNVGLLPYISARTHSETAAGGLEDFMRWEGSRSQHHCKWITRAEGKSDFGVLEWGDWSASFCSPSCKWTWKLTINNVCFGNKSDQLWSMSLIYMSTLYRYIVLRCQVLKIDVDFSHHRT